MKKILSLSVLALSLSIISCKEEKKTPEGPTQMERVMAIHDEVMPEMGKLGKLVGQLKAKVDTTEVGQQYEAAMKDLQEAHVSMMDWMKEFGDRFNSDEILNGKELTEQKQKWLNEEEEKVQVVKDQINNSIAKAEALLAKAKEE
ncbi:MULTISPECIES: hypothetical protein [Flagellimonas]|uniref:Viral A-type inclusion protein n=2 Tax=Flagellimonas TaxID=444459 RepID=A0A3A1NG21_9FLAO|nr:MULTISPECIES: hypothetical protein [Allomuricauda]RIV44061.1 hypothetical protein D2V05_11230 [Allomuricauda maritima]RIV70724.1 hypothetical protein D2U88_10210 [Allomuricauda aequoris]TXJ93964.1 hypothetical protein FQ017_11120 [Allomuricauda maritima]TXK02163.1 hypothetical protein FQ019_10130 [Allomuricauda aequoris]